VACDPPPLNRSEHDVKKDLVAYSPDLDQFSGEAPGLDDLASEVVH